MNKKNFIKGTTLPVALFFTIATFAPAWGLQTASAAVEVVQQQSTIKGTVVDSQGEPIIGASVLAEGTSNGTITDIDGVFRIHVRPGTKLKVSFIGYTDKKVVAKNDMKVILVEDVTALEEVEIVAYGTQKKVTMTLNTIRRYSSDCSLAGMLSFRKERLNVLANNSLSSVRTTAR